MVGQADITPLNKGWIADDHFVTAQGSTILQFIKSYRQFSGGTGLIPPIQVIQARFPSFAKSLPTLTGSENLEALSYEVRVQKVRADLTKLSMTAAQCATSVDPIAELGALRGAIDGITADFSSSTDLLLSDALNEQILAYDAGDILQDGLPWPWPTLDKATRGLHGSEFIVVCGRPKARKTFVALAVAAHAFRTSGARVLFVTPEMPPAQIMLRTTATVAALSYAEFKNAALEPEEEERLFNTAMQYARRNIEEAPVQQTGEHEFAMGDAVGGKSQPLFVAVKGTGQGLGYVASKIEEYRPHIVVVDSFYRLDSGNRKAHDADWKNVTSISRGLKDLAMAENVCVIGTHQLNREADKGVGSLANLALADAIGQDADLIARVITAKRVRTPDRSAIFLLGGRETAIEGVMINNVPCSDFEEVEEITRRDKVLALLQEEEEQGEEDDNTKTKSASGGKYIAPKARGIRSPTGDKGRTGAMAKAMSLVKKVSSSPHDLGS